MAPSVVTAGAAAVSALVTVVLAAVTYRYVRLTAKIADEATKNRRAMLYLQVERMMSDVRPLRHELYAQRSVLRRQVSRWTATQRRLADDVSVVYQRVSYLWALGLLEKDLIAEGWGKTFIDTWEIIEPWVIDYREASGSPIQRAHFERLVQELRKDKDLMATIYYSRRMDADGLWEEPR